MKGCKSLLTIMVFCILSFLVVGCSSSEKENVEPTTNNGGEETSANSSSSLSEEVKGTTEEWASSIRSENEGTKLRLAFASHPSTTAFQAMTEDFESLTGIEVEWEVMEETYLKNKQMMEFTAETGNYDVLMVDGFWLNEYGDKEIVQPLDEYINDPSLTPDWFDFEDIIPAYRNGISKFNEQTLGIPTAGETRFIGYRTDLFEKYDKQPPKTMEEFLELAQFFNGKENDLYGVSMRAQRGIHNASGLMTIMYNFGGGFIDQQTNEATLTDPKTVEALQFYVDLLKNAPPDVASYTHEEALSAFMSGKTAMWLDATALANQITDPEQSQVFDKVGFVPTPTGPEGDAAALAGWNMSLAKHSNNKEAAWALIMYMNSKLMAETYVNSGGIPVRTSIYENTTLVESNLSYPAQLESLERANALVEKGIKWIPPHPDITKMLDRIGYYGNQAVVGEITAQEAAEKSQKEVQEIVGE